MSLLVEVLELLEVGEEPVKIVPPYSRNLRSLEADFARAKERYDDATNQVSVEFVGGPYDRQLKIFEQRDLRESYLVHVGEAPSVSSLAASHPFDFTVPSTITKEYKLRSFRVGFESGHSRYAYFYEMED